MRRRDEKITKARRLAFLAGIDLNRANRVLDGVEKLDCKRLDDKLGVAPGSFEGFVADERKELSRKPNPNRLTLMQLRQLPGISAARAQRTLTGGPYFSLEEFATASGLSSSVASDLLEAPRYERIDKTRGTRHPLKPEPGCFVAELPPGFEENDPAFDASGFSIRRSIASRGQRFALVGPNDFQAASRSMDTAKRAVHGRLIPAVRDREGMLRFFAPRRIDIWFKQGTPPGVAAARIAALGLVLRIEASPKLEAVGFYPCEMPDWPAGDPFAAMLEIIRRAQEFEEVHFAEPDEIGVSDFPPETNSPPPAASDFEAAGRFWNHDLCKVAAAHALTRGNDQVTIITIDSGIATGHPDLSDTLRQDWPNLDLAFATEEPDEVTSPESSVSHGTKVAGIAVGNGKASEAVLGIAPGCRLLPIRISGDPTSLGYGMRAAAIRHALSLIGPGQRAVMNISWGMAGEHTGVRTAIEAALAKEVVIAMSAGNYVPGEAQTPDQLHYPSSYCRQFPNVVSVAAVTQERMKASYSFYGAKTVTLCAPGGEAGGAGASLYSADPPSGHAYTFGTSFSVVHASACAALMLSANNTLKAQRVVELMKASGQNLSPQESMAAHLGPLLDVPEAVRRAKLEGSPPTPLPTSDSPAPTPAGNGPAETEGPVFPMNINTATADQLSQVPSLSPNRAAVIVADRAQHGPYPSVWDLRRSGYFTSFILMYWIQENLLTA